MSLSDKALNTGDTAVNKIKKVPALIGLYVLTGSMGAGKEEGREKQKNK